MAHEISNVGFGDEVFTAGKPAWHGLGQNVKEAVTSIEAMKLAGLDWRVDKFAVNGVDDQAHFYVPEHVVTARRGPTGKPIPLGVVGEDYQVVQNAEAFDFMDGLVGEGQAAYETAGALKQGRRVWMLCRIPGDITVGNEEDVTRRYLLLANGHDGGMALRAFFTPIRVVCANTLRMSLDGAAAGVTLRHTSGIMDKLEEARGILGLAVKHYDDLGSAFNRFFKEAMKADAAQDYFRAVMPDSKTAENKARTENARDAMLEGFRRGRGAKLAGNTLWGAYNAVAEYATHTRHETKGRASHEDAAERRFESVMFGSDKGLTERAFKVAADMVGIG